jgi:elongation factor P hydroxylase
MEYSQETLVAIVQAHPSVMNEIEARDVVFRRKFDAEKRREISPWIMLGRKGLKQEEFELWLMLQAKDLSEKEAIEKMTDLMERYYGQRYPLR